MSAGYDILKQLLPNLSESEAREIREMLPIIDSCEKGHKFKVIERDESFLFFFKKTNVYRFCERCGEINKL